jgi:hypothetical protein
MRHSVNKKSENYALAGQGPASVTLDPTWLRRYGEIGGVTFADLGFKVTCGGSPLPPPGKEPDYVRGEFRWGVLER